MSRARIGEVGRYLLEGRLPQRGCLASCRGLGRSGVTLPPHNRLRALHHVSSAAPAAKLTDLAVPLRKQLKEEAKLAKKQGKQKSKGNSQTVEGWELTVGIEIHAQLNASRKLFSSATTSFNDEPNSHVAWFDVSMPGSQPLFQKESLIPALRAALALNCEINPVSHFDRKHYFWWDQPSGYQITQYYKPFAKDGDVTITARDGIAAEDGESVNVRIKQMQLEQDTAKTLAQSGTGHWLDMNRVGVPLIEIITEPDMHHPRTAAAFVRKVQLLLTTVDACVSGMEEGGLRVDVNVSVRETDDPSRALGTRTEIKNISTIKAVEDAIIAERDRQIRELEAGEVIASETRGWTLGSKETRRLRGKEGDVDYRYMPDPDIAPLVIGDDLVHHLRSSLPVLPDIELNTLISEHGLSPRDALALITLDNGTRAQYYYKVLEALQNAFRAENLVSLDTTLSDFKSYATLTSNWILHELGRLATHKAGPLAANFHFTDDGECAQVPVSDLAQLLYHLSRKRITGKVAKELLWSIYLNQLQGGITETIDANDLWFHEISREEYRQLAEAAVTGEEKVLREFVNYKKFPQGKLMYLVGRMLRLGPAERIDPVVAEAVMRDRVTKNGDL
ncbi:hypothetical protein E4U17_001066 [Claviceps sp. LM77 group G4]|nr:hypothetical protein E4U17_001066 [Claviceps sp. LM77 group G4]KAG6080843.1 hypothetical protein E4U33_007216 [Claviceps sp. LM78 group G4]KAG6084978.1 hypothetical protein E4U16_000435 [Claviceps sp. LM84 group G4]